MNKIRLYLTDGTVIEKEMKPQDEWQVDPVFMEGIGDDSALIMLIEKYFKKLKGVNDE